MNRFWKVFWIVFAAAFGAMIVLAIVLGIAGGSSEITYVLFQQSLAVALGICGIIGFVVIPIDMYLADRRQARAARGVQ